MTAAGPTPRQWLTLTLATAWIGGFTVYALLVVPTAAAVYGSHTPGGFVTQRVTLWFNALAALLALALLPEWRAARRRGTEVVARRLFAAAVAALGTLFVLHGWVGSHLDVEHRVVLDQDAFYRAHRVYLWTAMVHWLGTVAFTAAVVRRWLTAAA